MVSNAQNPQDEALSSANEEQLQDLAEAKRIRHIYNSGVPLFTKEQMRDLGKQMAAIKATRNPGIIHTTDLQGNTMECLINEGRRAQPSMIYRGIFQLLEKDPEISESRLLPIIVLDCEYPPGRFSKHLSVEKLVAQLYDVKAQWESGPECAELRALIKKTEFPRVRKIVGFGCGSLSEDSKLSNRPPIFQHTFMLTLRDLLQQKQGVTVQVVAQDPAYNVRHKDALSVVGIKAVDDPDGWLEVDDETIVFTVFPSVPVRQIIADIARPAAMIWRRVARLETYSSSLLDKASPRVEGMVRDYYREVDFTKVVNMKPPGLFDPITTLYVRKESRRWKPRH
ncbi:hypothetical protein V8F33_003234 [Rhypophila sp. PSN 637]